MRDIVRLIDDVNGARRSTYGELIKRGEKRKLPVDWPNRFFRRGSYEARGGEADPTDEPDDG
ncbi:MAG: hypothetical protein EXR72_05475 [Myxococcales bacterium]|nr:hypothetical protein [Myxococcales bacterium]